MSDQTRPSVITVHVTEEEYLADLAAGLQDDEVLQPGRHVFRRGGFLARHNVQPDGTVAPGKVRVVIDLDVDVLDYFAQRAAEWHAESYAVPINAALREVMEHEKDGLRQSNLTPPARDAAR